MVSKKLLRLRSPVREAFSCRILHMVVHLELAPICVAVISATVCTFRGSHQHKNFIEHPTLSKVYIF